MLGRAPRDGRDIHDLLLFAVGQIDVLGGRDGAGVGVGKDQEIGGLSGAVAVRDCGGLGDRRAGMEDIDDGAVGKRRRAGSRHLSQSVRTVGARHFAGLSPRRHQQNQPENRENCEARADLRPIRDTTRHLHSLPGN